MVPAKTTTIATLTYASVVKYFCYMHVGCVQKRRSRTVLYYLSKCRALAQPFCWLMGGEIVSIFSCDWII